MEATKLLRQTAQRLRAVWHPGLALTAVLLGGLCAMITDPGILYTDSSTRIGQAAAINAGRWQDLNAYLTLLPQFFIAAGYRLTQSYAAYIWAQASFFLWTLLEFIFRFFGGLWRAAVLVLVFASPLILGYSVFWEMNVVAAACLLWLVMLDDVPHASLPQAPGWRAARWVLYGILVFVMVGFRLNAATAAAGLLAWNGLRTLRGRQAPRELTVKTAAVVLGIALAFAFPRLVGVRGAGNGAFGFLWEACCIVHDAQDAAAQAELDALWEDGVTVNALALEEPEASYGAIGYGNLCAAVLAHSDGIFRLYARLVREHPLSFLRVKARMIGRTLSTLPEMAFTGAAFDLSENTPRRQQFCDAVRRYLDGAVPLRTPWLLFLLGGALGAAAWLRRRAALPLKLVFVAAFFESAFFVTTQSHEFRYFFPPCVLLLFACFAALQALWPAGKAAGGKP